MNNIIQDLVNNKNSFKQNPTFTKESTQNKYKTNRFFKDGEELGFFIDAVLDKYGDYPNVFYTGNINEHNRNFEQINSCDYGKGCNDFYNIVDYKCNSGYIPNGNGCFLKSINFVFNKDFSSEYYTFLK